MEQKPFKNPAVRSFFAKWCEINDSIEPRVVPREEWEEKREDGLLEKRTDGKQSLYIPEDLQLWEMVGVMEAVDHDTFSDKPQRQNEAKEKLLELGKTFQNAGIYIAQRADFIKEGGEIARALAEEFYNYGQALVSGKKLEETKNIDNIMSHTLTEAETETVDRFLAGDDLYESRQTRAETATMSDRDKKGEFYEAERQKTLVQFFRVSAKAFELERKSDDEGLKEGSNHLKSWQNDTPLHSAFIAKVEKAMVQKIETPKRELESSIFRRGMELLQKNMPFDTLPEHIKNSVLHWQNGEIALREALQIDRLKSELEDVRRWGDVEIASAKEREIADKIQHAVSGFSFLLNANNPSEMVASQNINCVGASMLGGALMQEAGLTYLVGDVPKHSILFLVTSDGNVEWRDMLNASYNEDLTDGMIVGNKKDGSPLTVADVAAFSKKPKSTGLMFDIESEKYRDKLKWVEKGQRQYVTVFEPEYGQKIQVLNSAGSTLRYLGDGENDLKKKTSYYNQAVQAFQGATAAGPQSIYPYNNLGNAFALLGREKEAVKAYREAVAVNPEFADSYYGLGCVLSLEHKKEAIEAYQKFIELADKAKDEYWIKEVEKTVAELKSK